MGVGLGIYGSGLKSAGVDSPRCKTLTQVRKDSQGMKLSRCALSRCVLSR